MSNSKKTLRINEQITAKSVRITGDDIESKVISLEQAFAMASDMGVDLIEITPNANPPVCRLEEYSKYNYKIKQKLKEQKKKSAVVETKEIKMGPNVAEHDLQTKIKHIKEFIVENKKVKATISFKKNELKYPERGELILLKIAEELESVVLLEAMPVLAGKNMTVVFKPKQK